MIDVTLPQIYVYDHVGVHALCWLNHLGKLPIKIVSTIESIKQKIYDKNIEEVRIHSHNTMKMKTIMSPFLFFVFVHSKSTITKYT
jgi:hypothetical protein